MPDPTISEFMARLGAALSPKAAGIDAAIQLKLTGARPPNGCHHQGCQCTLTRACPAPKLTVSADSADFIKIFSGQWMACRPS